MSSKGKGAIVAALAGLLVVSAAGAAFAQTTGVTLEADPSLVPFGEEIELSGEVDPAAPGIIVEIVDADTGETLETAVTEADGSYATTIAPKENVRVRAEADGGLASSDPVNLRVRPLLSARLRNVRLFDRARVTGRLRPHHTGRRVLVLLRRGSNVVARDRAPLGDNGRYVSRFRIARIGRYRAVVRFEDADHARARAVTGSRRVSTPPRLEVGDRGRFVRTLERRLAALNYHLPGVNRRFDYRTGDAVIAFHKIQGMPRTPNVSAATWRRLADPRRPHARSRRAPYHIEIDQTRQVLFVVDHGDITAILHTSTGAGGATNDGVFNVHRKLSGYSPNNLYMPSYFDGNRAVHGWPEVPTYPASHGCSRVPMWTAVWIYNRMPLGTQVRVYHS